MIHVCTASLTERADESAASLKREICSMCVHKQREQYNRLWIETLAQQLYGVELTVCAQGPINNR